ncbi:MAG: anti-phage dCTP deaminase [Allosphingosinicella sp.]
MAGRHTSSRGKRDNKIGKRAVENVELKPPANAAAQDDEADEEPEPKPELVIGLVGPVGTDLHLLARRIEEKLSPFQYRCARIRVSQLIASWCDPELQQAIKSAAGGERIRLLMDAGDRLRKLAGKGDAILPLIIGAIRAARRKFNKKDGVDLGRHAYNACYILDSLKHPDEVEALRRIYGRNFILVSGFDSEDTRRERLKDIIAKAVLSTETDEFEEEASELIKVDAKRPGERIGQNVRETFPLGDFFIRTSGNFESDLERFIDILFGSPYLTPRRGEYFMFEANAIAHRSADLSRQIGAVIVDRHGEIISAGCNEVPKAEGGAYWPDDDAAFDNRDYVKGKDFNAVKKFDIIKEVLEFLHRHQVMQAADGLSVDDAAKELLYGRHKELFKDLRVSNLIEFGRVVHAEMSALMRAAQRGIAVDGSELYSTTFPCHMCARHIISAGITRVVYIEPYPKSMTAELFPETVSIDKAPNAVKATTQAKGKRAVVKPLVRFDPFEGIAPSLFVTLFRAGKRKDRQGYIVEWVRADAQPKVAQLSEADLEIEQAIATELDGVPKVGLKECVA